MAWGDLHSYQFYGLVELGQSLLGALPGIPQLAQGVLVGSVAELGGQGPQAHKVTPLLPLLLHGRHLEAFHRGGQLSWREQEQKKGQTSLLGKVPSAEQEISAQGLLCLQQ